MAKVDAKTTRWDSVGWGFWLVCFVVLYGPCTYLGYITAYGSDQAGLLPWALGFFFAATAAGILSVIVNAFLQRRIAREKEQARRTAKKRK